MSARARASPPERPWAWRASVRRPTSSGLMASPRRRMKSPFSPMPVARTLAGRQLTVRAFTAVVFPKSRSMPRKNIR